MNFTTTKVYELALSSVKEQHLGDFRSRYIPNVYPIMAEYGGKFLINGVIRHSATSRYPVRNFALLEWPSIEQFIKINNDERMLPLLEERNRYLEFIIEGCFFEVQKDIEFEIPAHKSVTLLLSERAIPDGRGVHLQWIPDARNRAISQNLSISSDSAKPFDKDSDTEEFTIQLA
jgi:uncharacterized protein (DUF1330 family)